MAIEGKRVKWRCRLADRINDSVPAPFLALLVPLMVLMESSTCILLVLAVTALGFLYTWSGRIPRTCIRWCAKLYETSLSEIWTASAFG
jgi:hypothetical protein